ncbi:MAG: EAL domain-containing protein [Acidobacteriia bacterium]|nr:EAL domain-containing protein [Terriglobia bacterium]
MSHPARLLLVDDDEMNRDVLSRRLLRKGYEVELAEDGQQALDLVASRPFDLVLLDNMMPGLSGIEVLRRIRRTEAGNELPIIMVTAQHESENVVAALQLGANDYITKPVDFAVALARIESRLALSAASRELRRARDLYRLASRASEDGLWDWDVNSGRVYYSPRWKSLLGFSEGEIGDRVEEWFSRVHPGDLPAVRAEVASLLEGRGGSLEIRYRIRHKDGRYRWMENRGGVSRDTAGRALRMAGCQTDITARQTIDAETSLPNRLWLEEELRAAAERPSDPGPAGPERPGLLLCELDGFDQIDEALPDGRVGHLMAAVAERLRGVLTSMPEAASLAACRPADRQFAVLLRQAPSVDYARVLAGRIQSALNEPFSLDGETLFATVGVGIALAGNSTGDPLLRDASAALRYALEHGKGRIEVFQKELREHDRQTLRLESDLRQAVERREFEVHYQPKVNLESGEIAGFEALARWNRPGTGMVMPDLFIATAERTGLIVALGTQVLERACSDTVELRRSYPHLTVSVNVSGRQFAEPDLVEQVARCLASTGLPPCALHLEITESMVMEAPENARIVLHRLRDMGVELKLDDFGTGYSSLSYLHRFPFDVLKIDRSFVARLTEGAQGIEILRAIVDMARSLHMTVVAEGVETQEQAILLKALGCPYAQGYLFSPPVGLACLRELLPARFPVAATALTNTRC